MRLRDRIASALSWTATRFASDEWKPWDERWYSELWGGGSAGVPVTTTTALQLSTVNACLRLLSAPIAMLPVFVYERLASGGRRQAEEHEAYRLLHDRPNEYQTPYEFWEEIAWTLAARGNAYGERVFGRAGAMQEIWPINPDFLRVDWFNRRTGRRRVYDVSSAFDGRARVLTDDQVWHPRLMSIDGGLTGASPIRLASEGIGLSLAAQTSAASLARSGGRPSGVISSELDVSPENAKKLKSEWQKEYGGPSQRGKIAVLGNGAKFQSISITPEDQQLIETLGWGVADIARGLGGIPLHLLQSESKDTSWGSGIEHLKIGFVTFSVAPRIALLEQSAESAYIEDRRRHYVEFELAALLRGDLKSRYESYQIAVNANNPWLTKNEIRKLENLPPDSSGDGDRFMAPTNNVRPVDNETAMRALASLYHAISGNGETREAA